MTSQTPESPAGSWIGVGIAGAMLLVSLAAVVAQGVASTLLGENASVLLAYVLVPTALAGWLPLPVALLTRQKGTAAAVGGPIGCGVLVWGFGFVLTTLFFLAIWPEL